MTITDETLSAIVAYLGTCPYAQVAPILAKIQEDLNKNTPPSTSSAIAQDIPAE
jgi:hypothetical protein